MTLPLRQPPIKGPVYTVSDFKTLSVPLRTNIPQAVDDY